jgi:HlyD family secretion protein
MQLFEFQRDLATAQEHLSQKESERKGLESQILELKNKIEQQLLDLQNQITTAQDNLLAAMNNLDTNTEVVSPYNGRVVEAGVNVGSIVGSGSPIATLERAEGDVTYLEAILYFSPDQGQRVQEGMVVQVSPDTAKQERYGSMLALVTKVTAYPSSQAEMTRVLQNPELVRQLAAKGVMVGIRCVLVPDYATVSGYKWSSSTGPDFVIEPGTLCSASVIVERQRPISLLIPLFNKYVLGQGAREPASQP